MKHNYLCRLTQSLEGGKIFIRLARPVIFMIHSTIKDSLMQNGAPVALLSTLISPSIPQRSTFQIPICAIQVGCPWATADLLSRNWLNAAFPPSKYSWLTMCSLFRASPKGNSERKTWKRSPQRCTYFTEDLIAPSSSARRKSLSHLRNCKLKTKKSQPSLTQDVG